MRLALGRFAVLIGLLLVVLLCAGLAGSNFSPSRTTYRPVTTTADSGPGSLRAAIESAGDGDVVYFVPALNGQTINLTSGELAINSSITIQGPGANLLTVARESSSFRIFHVLPGPTVNIQGLKIFRGSSAKGGGILNDRATLNLNSCTISGSGSADLGGGIYNEGAGGSATLTIVDCDIVGNSSEAGGGIFNNGNAGSATVSMWNSRVTGNSAQFFQFPGGGGDGGGIANGGSGARMTLTNCIVSGNFSGVDVLRPYGTGGGISNDGGTLTIIGSTISDNTTQAEGGGLFSVGSLAIINSTVSGNRAIGTHDGEGFGYGGGIHSRYGTMMTLSGSTVSNNFASNSGGGIYGFGSITHSTISGNRVQAFGGSGGGIYIINGFVTIGHTILRTGTAGANIVGTVTSLGYNLSNDNGGGSLTGPGDQINTDPVLGPLGNNGGPTLTHAPLNGSPAIDAGNPTFTPPPYEDQRGFPRVHNGRVDIGSLELQPTPSPTPTPTPSGSPCGYIVHLSENFDAVAAPALPAGWSSSFTPGPANCAPAGTCALGTNWASNNNDPYSAPHCVFHDAPGCVTDSVLVTPSFVAGPTNQAYLTFQHSFDLENGRDGGVLEISIEGGPFVDFAEAGGHPGYNGTIASDSSSPLAGRAAWTGNSGGYQNRAMTFPFEAQGRNVRVRFRLATDCSGAGAGWRIDNIRVEDNIGCQPPSPTPRPPTPTPTASVTPTATVGVTPIPTPSRALNISTRLRVETGDRVMIGGFIITGSGSKRVALRGIGPSLGNFGITDALADPILEVRDSTGVLLVQNDNWRDNAADDGAQLLSLGLAPSHPDESGMVANLPSGASYTAILSGKNGGTGVSVVEVYDTDQGADSQLANISTRGFVQTGNNVMIGGFILEEGSGGTPVVVRGIGASLSQAGLSNVLADPTLELRNSNGMLLIANDNWQDDSASAAQLTARGLAPQNPLESGIFASLPAGAFTAVLTGKNGGSGIGLIEIYNVQ